MEMETSRKRKDREDDLEAGPTTQKPSFGGRIFNPNAPGPSKRVEAPPKLKYAISNLGGSEPILLADLTLSDITVRKNDEYFLIPIQEINKHGILTEDQRKFLEIKGARIDATLIEPLMDVSKISISKHGISTFEDESKISVSTHDDSNLMDESKISISQNEYPNYALSGWSNLLETHGWILTPSEGTQLQLWSFKKITQLGFIMQLNNGNYEILHQKQAQEIHSFGGSQPVFVLEKQLVQSDLSQFSIPCSWMHNEFLKEGEKKLSEIQKSKAQLDVVLIGPSSDEEFKVNLKKRDTMYYLEGPGWRNFVTTNKLDVDKEVSLWAFWRPANEAKTGFEAENYCSQPGFAWVV